MVGTGVVGTGQHLQEMLAILDQQLDAWQGSPDYFKEH